MGSDSKKKGFSLLELVVVIGIVAIMGGMLIATVSRVRGRIGDISCQNNIRQILYGLCAYTMDNGGSYPYGWYYKNSDPVTWEPAPGSDGSTITWIDVIDPYLSSGSRFSSLLQCPEAQQQAGAHPVSYVMNMIVAISPHTELVIGQPPYAQLKPSTTALVRREGTALLWDTAIQPSWQDNVGFIIGADIDNQRFWYGAASPQFRYFSPDDPFGLFGPTFSNNSTIRLNVGSFAYRNIDPPTGSSLPYQGNLRFRHSNFACNLGFSDGSVRQFTAVIGTNNAVASHDAVRRHFMTNWPPNTPADPTLPYGSNIPSIIPPHRNPLR